jgi:hypothetical protein
MDKETERKLTWCGVLFIVLVALTLALPIENKIDVNECNKCIDILAKSIIITK